MMEYVHFRLFLMWQKVFWSFGSKFDKVWVQKCMKLSKSYEHSWWNMYIFDCSYCDRRFFGVLDQNLHGLSTEMHEIVKKFPKIHDEICTFSTVPIVSYFLPYFPFQNCFYGVVKQWFSGLNHWTHSIILPFPYSQSTVRLRLSKPLFWRKLKTALNLPFFCWKKAFGNVSWS